MRAVAGSTTLSTAPGGRVDLDVDVINTSDVIDGITGRVIGLDPATVSSRPPLLPLFPAASGRLSVGIDVPATFPAGRHPLTLELASSIEGQPPAHVDFDLLVAPRPQLRLTLRPAVQRAHRRARYLVECRNLGNLPLTVRLTAEEPERAMRWQYADPALQVEPGAVGSTLLTLRARRRMFGSDLDRPVTVHARAAVGEDVDELAESAVATLRQRPLIPRGVLTVVILACIVGLWAGAFLLGLTKVFSGDPLTKSAPASFFVSARAMTLQAAVSNDGMLSKTGALPPGVGGGITGTVTAASTGSGVGRIVVEALRPTGTGPVLVASAATQTDGSYALLGLLPGGYYLRFSAPGFRTSWYPSVSSLQRATRVSVAAQELHRDVVSNVSGLPASITGQVDAGDTLHRPTTVVTARSLQGGGSTAPVARATTDAQGRYVLRGLPAPGSYELGFTTPGYSPTTVLEKVGGGQSRSEPSVRLSAGVGTITGDVVQVGGGASQGLGGVSVTTSQNGQALATATPTSGQVGHFALTGLATPGTYVITFAKPGYGAFTQTVDLAPGDTKQLLVKLRSGTGTVDGDVVDSAGNKLGGVAVTVGGVPAPVTTTSLTDGAVGHYALSGLPVPGSYTLTFTRAGYAPQTVPIRLDAEHPAAHAGATLTLGVGRIVGRVVDAGTTAVPGATVTVTDGLTVRTGTSVGSGAQGAGSYLVGGLPPGTYTVTVSGPKMRPQTALVTVRAAADACQNLRLVAASAADPGDPPPCA